MISDKEGKEFDRTMKLVMDYRIEHLSRGWLSKDRINENVKLKDLLNKKSTCNWSMWLSLWITVMCLIVYWDKLSITPIIFFGLGIINRGSQEMKERSEDELTELNLYCKRCKRLEELDKQVDVKK